MKIKPARRLTPALLALVVALGAIYLIAATKRRPPMLGLKVPDGFIVERVAGPPLVDRPITADFDEQGRLYVADSSGSNDKVEEQLAKKPHRIVRLEDTNGDGRFDKSTVFADKMMFPEGTLWFDGSLYVSAPPSIWKLTDTNGDGVADQREEWFQGKTLTNCANDLHGPYLGLDGWIYWAKGAFAQQTYERPGKPPLVSRASHILRRRPGSSYVEPVMNGGMDNPVDVVFTPEGERIFTATFVQRPESGRRDGLVHAIYGGVYGKVNNATDDHKKTGDLMPVMTHLGPAVPSGLTLYASKAFGEDYRGNLFAALFNLHKVTRHVLQPSGSTFTTRDINFLVSENPDFHPTDVLEDADGSLLVVDTGAWYKLCCPSSQLSKPDLLGAIYRIRRRGLTRTQPADPRGLRMNWAAMNPRQLAKLLDDPRPAVRNRAIEQLARQGAQAVPVLADMLKTSLSVEARRNAVWTLTRVETQPARDAVCAALGDADKSVRQAACHSAGLWRDAGALPQLLELLRAGLPELQRAAAEAVGRIGDKRAVAELLANTATPHDRVLEHSLTYALIEIADPVATAAGLRSPSPHTRRAALVALDQMDGGDLKADSVQPLLNSDDPLLKQTAWWIFDHRPQWAPTAAGFLQRRLTAKGLSAGARDELEERLARFAHSAEIQELLAATVRADLPDESRLIALRAMAHAPLKEIPDQWSRALVDVTGSKKPDLISAAVAAARALPSPQKGAPELDAALLRVARDHVLTPQVRLDSLAALSGGLKTVDAEDFGFLLASLDVSQPVSIRSSAAAVLAKARLSGAQLAALTEALKTAGPMELPRLIDCYGEGGDQELGLKLIAALKESKARASLRPDILKPRLAKFPPPVQQAGEKLLTSLHTDLAQQKARLEKLAVELKSGDVRRGQTIFNGTKAACSSCHTIGYLGGKVGPDLTRIGQIRTERDLLESVVFPNASFVRSYEPIIVETKSGDIHNGVLRKDAAEEIVLAVDASNEVRISRADIAEMRPGAVSIMPAGVADQLTRQELADLVAFLKQTRWGAR